MNPFSSNIHDRLKALDARKKTREKIIDDLRMGKYDGIINGSEFFRKKEEQPSREEKLLESMPDMEILRGASGQTLFRSLSVPRGVTTERGYTIPLPFRGTDAHPLPEGILHHLSKDFASGDSLDIASVCFLDTETTGLMGGTGTVPFLVGIGWWESVSGAWAFRLEQFLIEDFCHEGDMLERIVERLSRFKAVCTYNGKTFDMPLLRARGIMHRIPPARFRLKHIDLLHSARRWWKTMLESVSLRIVERDILRIERGPDVEGALIPSIFFNFARTGRTDRLPAVLDHNAQDIVSLGALLTHLSEIARDPMSPGLLSHAEEFASAARWFVASRNWDDAAAAYRRALEKNSDTDREYDLLGKLAALHKKRRDWNEALEILHHLKARPIARSLPAWVEIAKYHEHVGKDPQTAVKIVAQCRKQIELEREIAALRATSDSAGQIPFDAALRDLHKRETRLRARIERASRPKTRARSH